MAEIWVDCSDCRTNKKCRTRAEAENFQEKHELETGHNTHINHK